MLTNLGGGVNRLSLVAFGTVTDGGVTKPWSGSFLANLTGTTAEAVQTAILGGGSISRAYTGTFVISAGAAVPEPGSVALVAMELGLMVAGRVRRR